MPEKTPPKKRTRNLTSVKKANAAAILQAEENRLARRAWELKRAGRSWWEIAETLQIPEARGKALVDKAIAAAADLVSEHEKRQLLVMEVERLDALQAAHWDSATEWTEVAGIDGPQQQPPSVKAGEFILKVSAQRARLLGLDEAASTSVTSQTVIVGGTSAEYIDTLRQLRERIVQSDVVEEDAS
jgi:hypothetical protein